MQKIIHSAKINLKGTGYTWYIFSAILKGENFCDFHFAFLSNLIPNGVYSKSEEFALNSFLFEQTPFQMGGKAILTQLPPEAEQF